MRLILSAACLFLSLSVCLSAPAPARAQVQDPILSLPDGQVILNISATVRKEVPQDLLVGTLSYVAENRNSGSLQNEINTVMAKALAAAQKVDSVKVSTGSYQVYENIVERTKEKIWRGEQSITVKSMKPDDVLKLAADLQDMGLTMNGLSYTLAPETAVAIEDGLMEDALKQLQVRADRAAKALGKSSAEMRDVNASSSGIPYFQPQPHMAMMEMSMAKADMAAPVAAAGDATITLSVNARAILKP